MPSISRVLNHPLFNIAFFLAIRQITKYFHLEQPSYLVGFRVLYYGAQLLIVLLNLYLISIVNKKNDQTLLKYVEPSRPGWDGVDTKEKLVVITYADYDKQEVYKAMKQSAIGIAMVTFLHFKFGYIQPLIMQAILGFKAFFMTKEAKIHLFNQPTTSGELKRPFRAEAPMGMSQMYPQPKTDKASIKKAERAMKAD
ncbi:inorganic phosphate transporter Pho88 [Gongronella butleri]|nr:inorganic phosphate transporter Pho88 [Gongronella butleri]